MHCVLLAENYHKILTIKFVSKENNKKLHFTFQANTSKINAFDIRTIRIISTRHTTARVCLLRTISASVRSYACACIIIKIRHRMTNSTVLTRFIIAVCFVLQVVTVSAVPRSPAFAHIIRYLVYTSCCMMTWR